MVMIVFLLQTAFDYLSEVSPNDSHEIFVEVMVQYICKIIESIHIYHLGYQIQQTNINTKKEIH